MIIERRTVEKLTADWDDYDKKKVSFPKLFDGFMPIGLSSTATTLSSNLLFLEHPFNSATSYYARL